MAMHDTDVCYALAPEHIAQLTGVDVTTARRWKRAGSIPEPARRLLQILTGGDLEAVCRAWRGWWFQANRGVLVSPEGWAYEPGHILSLPFLHGMVDAYQDELATQRARFSRSTQADWVLDRWTEPGETFDDPAQRVTPLNVTPLDTSVRERGYLGKGWRAKRR